MQKGAESAREHGGSTACSCVQLLEADGAVGQGTVLQRLPSSSDRPPQTIAIMMALRTPLRSAGIVLGGDAPRISSSLVMICGSCGFGGASAAPHAPLDVCELLKPSLAAALSKKSPGDSLSQHVGVGISGLQTISEWCRGKTKADVVTGMLFLRGRVALCWALVTCCFMESL